MLDVFTPGAKVLFTGATEPAGPLRIPWPPTAGDAVRDE